MMSKSSIPKNNVDESLLSILSYKRRKKRLDISAVQISDIAPLAQRNKFEEEAYEKLQKCTKELNKDAWVKAVKLMKGEWTPFPEYLRCYASSRLHKPGALTRQRLVLEFKNAVLSRNWDNAVKLAEVIFKNYSTFHERIHLQVFLSLLMSHPNVDEEMLNKSCSFLWKMEDKEAIAELIRCFCSMPKELPSEFFYTYRNRKVYRYVRGKGELPDKKTPIEIKYTSHLGTSSDNDMYID